MTRKTTLFTFSIISIIIIFSSVVLLYFLLSGLYTIEAGSFRNSNRDFANRSSGGANGEEIVAGNPDGDYFVYKENMLAGIFSTYEEAYSFAQNHKYSSIKKKGITNLLWDNYPPYNVFTSSDKYYEFDTYADACAFANEQDTAYVYYRGNNSLIFGSNSIRPESAFINNVPHNLQLPELPRGCEVTSLSMLINYMGVDVDKITLAEIIEKNTEPYVKRDGKIFSGNPNDGFVGSMTSFDKFGLGVYHKPIYNLLRKYFPDSAIDITGSEFEELYSFILKDSPVWVIINSQYKELPKSSFEKWHTPSGVIDVTYREHSVLITGYDEKKIYFLDPLGCKSSAPKDDFIKAWEQMGRQAVSVAR